MESWFLKDFANLSAVGILGVMMLMQGRSLASLINKLVDALEANAIANQRVADRLSDIENRGCGRSGGK